MTVDQDRLQWVLCPCLSVLTPYWTAFLLASSKIIIGSKRRTLSAAAVGMDGKFCLLPSSLSFTWGPFCYVSWLGYTWCSGHCGCDNNKILKFPFLLLLPEVSESVLPPTHFSGSHLSSSYIFILFSFCFDIFMEKIVLIIHVSHQHLLAENEIGYPLPNIFTSWSYLVLSLVMTPEHHREGSFSQPRSLNLSILPTTVLSATCLLRKREAEAKALCWYVIREYFPGSQGWPWLSFKDKMFVLSWEAVTVETKWCDENSPAQESSDKEFIPSAKGLYQSEFCTSGQWPHSHHTGTTLIFFKT